MSYREILDDRSIAVSTSDSPDMPGLGLQKEHLRDAMGEIAKHILALGAKLVYGGDLRAEGFSKLLFELAARYRRDTKTPDKLGVTNYLAWPVHILQKPEQLEKEALDLAGAAELRLLDLNGKHLDFKERHKFAPHQPTEPEWAQGLSSMRKTMLRETDARIILGGRVDSFKGDMPGIAEEALFSLKAKQPLYIMGGFGGCARDVAEAIGIVQPTTSRDWRGRERFNDLKGTAVSNGLSADENRILANTAHVDQAIVLILRGLAKVKFSRRGKVV
jgi:hypothetical protein